MTCGIYILKFNGTDKVYVGQSLNIESRYLGHLSDLRRGKSSNKMLDACATYGEPYLEVLVECQEHELNINENEAIEVFNSVNNGFNTLEHAEDMPSWKSQLKGENGGTAIYSNQQILEAAKLMCDYTLNLVKVSELTGISYATIRKIAQGAQHRWLSNDYPEIWDTLQSVKEKRNQYTHLKHGDTVRHLFTAKAQGITYPEVVSPTGEVFNIENLAEFCRTHDLQSANIRKMFKGERHTHKGWKLLNSPRVQGIS